MFRSFLHRLGYEGMPLASNPDLGRRLALAVLAAALLSGCARDVQPATPGELARIRAACPPGSFAAAMASNCPEVVR